MLSININQESNTKAYHSQNFELLVKQLKNPDQRYHFAEWLRDNFNPLSANQDNFNWHSRVISLLSEQAVNHPSQSLTDQKNEDLLIACLITHASPLKEKYHAKFKLHDIPLNTTYLPFTCAILLKRKVNKENLEKFIYQEIKNNNLAKLKIIAAQNTQNFKKSIFYQDDKGHLGLGYAAYEGNLEILKFIAEAAPTEFKTALLIKSNSGRSLVALAILKSNLEILKFIAEIAPIEFKKTILLQNNEGNTSVLEAAFLGHLEILKFIAETAPIEFKKTILLQNNKGQTPIYAAICKNNMKALKLIEEYAPIEFKQAQFLDIKEGEDNLHILAIHYIEDIEMLKWLVQIFPETTYKVSKDGRSALDEIKKNRPHNYKEIIDLYKNSHLNKCNKERVKRLELSHGWDLFGDSWLIAYETGEIFNKLTLEGHFSAQWFHILGKDLDLFKQSYPKLLNDFEAKLFKEVFDISANSKCFSLENKLARIKKGLPIMINSGFIGHSVTLLIWDKQIVICNRGALSRRPLEIYHFNPESLDLNDLNELLKTNKYGTYLDYQKLYFEELPKKLLFTQTELDKELEIVSTSLPYQIVGNCSFISPITAFYAMKLLMEVRKIEKGEKFYQTAILEEGEDEFFSLESSSEENELESFFSLESSSDEDSTFLSSKIIDQETLVNIKEEHNTWFETWLSFTKISFLERNIRPLENKPYFKPDDLLILKTLDKAHLLPLDDLCKKKLNELSKIFYNYFVTNS